MTIRLFAMSMILLSLASCGGADTKADPSEQNADTYNKESSKSDDQIPEAMPSAAAAAAPEDSLVGIPDNNEILAKIDRYIISTPVYNADAGGISNAVVTVKNTLPKTTVQKAIVEVNTMDAAGHIIRNDFYTIQNLEPGDLETIKIPVSGKAASLVSHIVKLKSNELTNGEMLMVGTLFNSGK